MTSSSDGVKLITVAGRVYRCTADLGRLGHTTTSEPAQKSSDYGEDESQMDCDARESQYFVDQRGDDFFITLHIDTALVRYLIGARGSTKARLETETGCKINITQSSREPAAPAQVSIRAASHQAAVSAADRVQLILDGALTSTGLEYTHFVSVPLASAEFQAGFTSLKEAVLADKAAQQSGIEASLFADARKLHLTLAMLKLYTEERRHRAAKVLEKLRGPISSLLGSSGLQLALKGLQYMNDDPSSISVLFMGVEEVGGTAILQALAKIVLGAYNAEGLLLGRDNRPFKPHVTIMSARLRHNAENGSGAPPGLVKQQHQHQQQGGNFANFDGRSVLEHFGDADFGVQKVEALELSQRHTADAKTGYYAAAARLPI